MAFLEQRLSTAVVRGSTGGPTALRVKVYDGVGDLQQQTFLRQYPRHIYNLDFGNKEYADADEIRDFFMVVLFTPYTGFRVRDWNDYQLTHSNSRLTFVSGTEWSIDRLYTVGAVTFARPIAKPETGGTFVVQRTRGGVVTTATQSVDTATGLVTIAGHAGGDTYTIAGNFDVPVTFRNDDALSRIALDGNPALVIQGLGQIELEEIPV